MLPLKINPTIQTEMLPTQNIGRLDQNQPQIYSLLTTTSKRPSMKKPRRKKTPKSDEIIPVMINPQITRNSAGVAFAAPHHYVTRPSEPKSPFVPAHQINDPRLLFRLYIDSSYDTNHNQVPSLSMSLNSSSSYQTQQTFTESNHSVSAANINSMPRMLAQPQIFGINTLPNNHVSERTVAVLSTQQNTYQHSYPSFMTHDQGSLLNYCHSLPMSFSSLPVSAVLPTKPKRKYSKKVHPPAPLEQQQPLQQTSSSLATLIPSTISNDLPSIIPASVTTTLLRSEEHCFSNNIATTSNFLSLTPPSSICSIKSPPAEIANEYFFMSAQQSSLTQPVAEIIETNFPSKRYSPNHECSHTQKTDNSSYANTLSPYLHQLLTAATTTHAQCGTTSSELISTNMLPTAYSSISPDTLTSTTSLPTLINLKKERRKREKVTRKTEVARSPIAQISTDEQTLTSKSLTTAISEIEKRKQRKSKTKDTRTKYELRRIIHRNRLAVLKFMMRKRKQQQQERISSLSHLVAKTELAAPQIPITHVPQLDQMETNLPDLITPCLKISIDATQKIESISLYYHRRRKPDITDENSILSGINADNKLGLLIEAVEFIETLHGSSKLVMPSVKLKNVNSKTN